MTLVHTVGGAEWYGCTMWWVELVTRQETCYEKDMRLFLTTF